MFTFEVKEGDTVIASVTNDAAGKIAYPTISYVKNSDQDDCGTHTYTVKETSTDADGITVDTNEYTVTVTVSDNEDGTLDVAASDNATALDFVNTYEAKGSTTFEGTKTIEGRELTADDVFTFEVKEGDTVIASVTNDAAGKIAYPTIEYVKNADQDDCGTHTYTVRETSKDGNGITVDTQTYAVTVEVSDNGDGTLKAEPGDNALHLDFVNTYGALASVTFEGTKKLEGRDLTEEDVFSFEITEGEGEQAASWSATSDAAGKISYPTISYVKNDTKNDCGTHVYTVKETSKDGNGITVDTTAYTVTVEVTDNGDGTLKATPSGNYTALDFTNTYSAEGTLVIEGTKVIENRAFEEGDKLTVTVEAEDGAKLPDPSSIEVDLTEGEESADFSFAEITYDLTDLGGAKSKVFEYVVTEEADMHGTTPDPYMHSLTVTVTDNGKGELTVEKNYVDGDRVSFINTYGDYSAKVRKLFMYNGVKTKMYVEDAVLQVSDSAGNVIDTWTTGKTDHEVSLTAGEYTLEEITLPEKYAKYMELADPIPFTVTATGEVLDASGEAFEDSTIVMYDEFDKKLYDEDENEKNKTVITTTPTEETPTPKKPSKPTQKAKSTTTPTVSRTNSTSVTKQPKPAKTTDVKTGDTTNAALPIAAGVLSLIAIAFVLISWKKRRKI